ncbi:hypothetical protein N7539_008798 [Penicillium diatomitis]|uniref:Uncharacterized protein n=1 Tax=Penicillium diatomitis TaxID=2819901 RepID=A0A9W9WQK2_9EURO|nr:uncharacterized protein N7539_008798 [Penicillium diatomitis]KAJ5471855.1 hypothetical protein N7539_008798 [Penicillium diatomitis]
MHASQRAMTGRRSPEAQLAHKDATVEVVPTEVVDEPDGESSNMSLLLGFDYEGVNDIQDMKIDRWATFLRR